MIWLLLSGYFIIAGIFYHTMGHEVLNNVIKNCNSEEDAAFCNKYGTIFLALMYLFWPLIIIIVLLLIIFILIKK